MKPLVHVALAVLVLASCKPQKPWSPYDSNSSETDAAAKVDSSPSSTDDRYNADIGDVEQAVFVTGEIADASRGANVQIKRSVDRNKNVTISNVTLTPPYPESLWAQYTLTCRRNFMSAPAILRAKILVDGKDAGSFSAVLGTNAKKNGVAIKVDLLKPLAGNIPESFLANVEGDLYLMPDGTDENSVNAETATSDIHSRALYATVFRVNRAKEGEAAAVAPAGQVTPAAPTSSASAAPADANAATIHVPSPAGAEPLPATPAPAAPAQ